jgi:hypothetical protein
MKTGKCIERVNERFEYRVLGIPAVLTIGAVKACIPAGSYVITKNGVDIASYSEEGFKEIYMEVQ